MKKIFVLCPYMSTGGPQTLHQLVDKINTLNLGDAYIVYLSGEKQVLNTYDKYNIKIAAQVEDKKDNIVIVPETATNYLANYKNVKKMIWWLSLDYYFVTTLNVRVDNFMRYKKLPKFLKPFVKILFNKFSTAGKIYKFDDNDTIFHLYNCEYARLFLIENGIKEKNMMYLCGPIREEFFKQNPKINRENIVLYNPKKGMQYTKKIIDYFEEKDSEIKFVPIQNMNFKQIIKLMNKSKVYMDFGYFPGPERIPREAVSMGCCIITGKVGSSKNNVDVPIPNKYKFDVNCLNLEKIFDTIHNLVTNYDETCKEYDIYRKKAKDQVSLFDENIKIIFK